MTSSSERLQLAAVELFAERGFHGTGIRDLARHAGLSSATLYHYAGTKQELLARVMTSSLSDLVERAEQAVGAAADPAEQMRALVGLHVRRHAEEPARTAVVDGEVRALEEPHRSAVLALRDRYEQLWQQVIDDGVRTGAFRVGDPRLARLALLEMCSGVGGWFAEDGRLDADAVAREFEALALALLGGA